MINVVFTNDNDASIMLPEHPYSKEFATRDNHEIYFRKISTILINNNIVKRNIIDLGCWVGDNAIPWAKNIKGIVYAIDPSPENCLFVKSVAELNNITNIKTIEKAISDKQTVISTNYDLHHCPFNSDELGTYKITADSLDNLYNNKILEDVDYIHLDVEGMEKLVIVGADKLINDYRPIIAFEQHLETDDYIGLCSYLRNKNFKTFLINETLPGCRIDCRNLIAIPHEKNYELIKQLILQETGMPELLITIGE